MRGAPGEPRRPRRSRVQRRCPVRPDRAQQCGRRRNPGRAARRADVSYTHLDVYKRQSR
ncbi:hypothetical protein [Arthrobacter sp. KBS0703]|uniref:hypothetical protein n=1 Tax=Arthrobacter sp. KBS0703 TaxID=1955698 RepID=UPI00163D70A9|nr:hypothetical protein [Arthrobacter sp. KBS0703]